MLHEFSRFFVRFFENHGFLRTDRPLWKTIRGGAVNYVSKLIAPFSDRIHLQSRVDRVSRDDAGVSVVVRGGEPQRFDRVVIATHSDQALALLPDAAEREREILQCFAYQPNQAVLHTDRALLPKRRLAWASWNYFIPPEPSSTAVVTYLMNRLQQFETPEPICVTLNRTEAIDPAKILYRTLYHHPVYTLAAVAAQARWAEINGNRNTYFCGAYWGNGFHEDGVNSGLAVAKCFGQQL